MGNYENFTAVIYMRLSKEDANDESQSIKNQREMIRDFCNANKIVVLKEFFDDGFSGGNFDRPGFQKMIEYVQKNRPNLVITKDLSRLGRDMTESSMYAEQFFTNLGVRYLAIRDGFDSFEDNLWAPFQFAMNDVYIRDISRKIKDVITQKKKSGKYCACPPFGYKKSNQNKDILIPDEVTAPIVQRIFYMCASGISLRKIAEILTADGVITPLKYRVMYRDEFSQKGASRATDEWNYTTVKRIVINKVYLGHTVLGKTKKPSLKSDVKIKVPQNEWYITENTHEPLVTEDVYNRANDNIRRYTRSMDECRQEGIRKSIFSGLVFCENCGAPMCSGGSVYGNKSHSYWYLTCLNIPIRSKNHCEHGARIKYYDLIDIVKNDLNSLIALTDDQICKIIDDIQNDNSSECQNKVIISQIEAIQREISDSNKMIEKLYRDNISGKISDERLDALISSIENKINQSNETIVRLREQIIEVEDAAQNYEQFFEIVRSYSHIDDLTVDILHAFIDRIEIGEKSIKNARMNQKPTQNIRIIYKFIGDAEAIAS